MDWRLPGLREGNDRHKQAKKRGEGVIVREGRKEPEQQKRTRGACVRYGWASYCVRWQAERGRCRYVGNTREREGVDASLSTWASVRRQVRWKYYSLGCGGCSFLYCPPVTGGVPAWLSR